MNRGRREFFVAQSVRIAGEPLREGARTGRRRHRHPFRRRCTLVPLWRIPANPWIHRNLPVATRMSVATHPEGALLMSVRKPVLKPVFLAVVGSVLAAGLLLVTSLAQDKKPEKKTAREVYKNIRVLPKDLPADQVIP